MRRLVLVLAALATVGLAVAAPAGAITNGSPDGNAHPNVGGLVADQAYSDGTWIYCSGTLISPTVFLTAAHCDEGGGRVRVAFSSGLPRRGQVYAGKFHADPAYPGPTSAPHDIAVVVLDKAVKGIAPATLPAAGSLRSCRRASLHLGGLRRLRGAPIRRAVTSTSTTTSAASRPGRSTRSTPLAADLDEPREGRRRHLLRRLRRPELPRVDRHRRGYHDHRRLGLPVDQRGLPARHRAAARRSSAPTSPLP